MQQNGPLYRLKGALSVPHMRSGHFTDVLPPFLCQYWKAGSIYWPLALALTRAAAVTPPPTLRLLFFISNFLSSILSPRPSYFLVGPEFFF